MLGGGAFAYWAVEGQDWTPDRLAVAIAAFVLTCWGVVLAWFGGTCVRKNSFPLLFLLFMVPLPPVILDVFIGFLQRSSTEVSDVLFSLFGVPIVREGFVFSLSQFTIYVAEECSGIRSFLSLVITSLLAGYWFLETGWARVGLVVLVVPLAIAKNAMRIVGLALLANYVDPAFITNSPLHRSGGIPLFLLSLIVLICLAWLLRRWESRPASKDGSVRGSMDEREGRVVVESHTVRVLDPLTDLRWPGFVERHAAASAFHSRGWLRALQMTYGYQPLVLTTSRPTEPLTNALLLCVVQSWVTGDRVVSLPFTDHCEPLVENIEQLRALCAHLETLRRAQGWKYAEMRTSHAFLGAAESFRECVVYQWHRLDLRPGLDTLYRGFHKDCIRRRIGHAERQGLRYEEEGMNPSCGHFMISSC